jgi:hypothetical protein
MTKPRFGTLHPEREVEEGEGHIADPPNPPAMGRDTNIGALQDIVALQRTLAKRLDLFVQQRADPADLRPRDAQAKALHELVDATRGDAAHIGLLHDRHQRLLTAPARLQKRWEAAALPELGALQLDLPGSGVPRPGAIAIAPRRPVLGALTKPSADQL